MTLRNGKAPPIPDFIADNYDPPEDNGWLSYEQVQSEYLKQMEFKPATEKNVTQAITKALQHAWDNQNKKEDVA